MAGLPYSIRVNVNAPFPARVSGAAGITVVKANGIWTVRLDFSSIAPSPSVADPANTYTLVWNSLTGVYSVVPISVVASQKSVKVLTAAGPYTAQSTDEVLIIKQTAGAAFTINVDWSARSKPLRIVDGKGDAAANNISIVPTAGQTQLASLNYTYVIDGNGGSITLTPLPDGTGAY